MSLPVLTNSSIETTSRYTCLSSQGDFAGHGQILPLNWGVGAGACFGASAILASCLVVDSLGISGKSGVSAIGEGASPDGISGSSGVVYTAVSVIASG